MNRYEVIVIMFISFTVLPPKKELHRIIMGRLDKNKDGVLSFYEVKDLLEVAAVVTSESSDE